MIFSFSGLDGTGKTTQIRFLSKKLKSENHAVTIVLVYASGTYLRLGNLLRKISPQGAQTMIDNQYKNRLKLSLGKTILRWTREICLVFDVAVFVLNTYLKDKNSSKIIFCDRYFYDILVHMQYVGMCSEWFYRWIGKFVPPCTVSFLLLDSVDSILRRKREYHLEYYIEKDKLYRRLSKTFKVFQVEGKSLEETSECIYSIIKEFLRVDSKTI